MDLEGVDAGHPVFAGMRAIVSALHMAAMVVDQTGTLIVANRRAQHLLAAPDDQDESSLHLRCRDAVTQMADTPGARMLALRLRDGSAMNFHGRPLDGFEHWPASLMLLVEASAEPAFREGDGAVAAPDLIGAPPKTRRSHHRALRKEAARLRKLCDTDPLTGLLNVRGFEARVQQALADRPGRLGALVFVDLNDFKSVNDRYGHAAGDRVLKHVAEKLTYPPHTWIATARVGGDEFALWMPGVDEAGLPEAEAGIRARLSLSLTVDDATGVPRQVGVSAAVGSACCPSHATSYDALRMLSDQRMYEDKS